MCVLDLFSGIGGFSLGLERAGMQTVAFCEIDPFCRAVLAKHWPGVPCYDDVRSVTAAGLAADGIVPDLLCGGFPCQDISFAGAGAGLAGARSGLWHEMLRIIAETRPRYVIAENVSALRSRGLDVVLGGLAAIGYDAEWHCIPAAAVGAPHRRDRVWIVAYARCEQHEGGCVEDGGAATEVVSSANADSKSEHDGAVDAEVGGAPQLMADASRNGRGEGGGIVHTLHATSGGHGTSESAGGGHDGSGWWAVEPDVGRVADGVPARVDRLRSLGNAVVPQIPELIGRAILAAEQVAA